MTSEKLDNLVEIGQLKHEPPDLREFNGLVAAARQALNDACVEGLSEEGRFSLAYGAAHALALAAMRWHGYRSDHRYLVFQCLEHTVGMRPGKWRVLAECHRHRNLQEYEGRLDIPRQLIEELVAITEEQLPLVERLGFTG